MLITCNRCNTTFTRYSRLSNRIDNRFDNRVERTAVRSTGCQTGLYNRFDNRLYKRYNRLSNNRFDNRLYRVNGAKENVRCLCALQRVADRNSYWRRDDKDADIVDLSDEVSELKSHLHRLKSEVHFTAYPSNHVRTAYIFVL